LFRRAASAIINKGVQKSTGVMMHDYGCMLRAYHRHIVDAMLMCNERSTFIPILANSFARRTTEIEVKHEPRKLGESKYNLMKLVMLQFDLLTSMTTFPLRLLSILGGIVSLAGIGFGVFLLIMRALYGAEWAAEGVFTLFAILFIFVGAQFVGMGLLGEYIGRIYHDVRARPRFFVQRVAGEGKITTKT
ncbi:MAG: undecaprenyl-phosphate 4-deoxy-4-formamido-L-arabinose transferase, partial [Deltaproteobacteria bacterium]|nr:undecaprenyl-phosphate 4-deoxy-4-formamido-L-arabinose transferase [Deltaproteobacteria bacterium]